MIVCNNIHKHYGDVAVLKGVDLHIKKGEHLTNQHKRMTLSFL